MIDAVVLEYFDWSNDNYGNYEFTPDFIKHIKSSYGFACFKAGMTYEYMKKLLNYEENIPQALNKIHETINV